MPLEYAPTLEKFKKQELEILQRDSDGPLNSFVIEEQVKKEYLDIAASTGSIEGQDYADCPIFRVEERKQHRYNLKRGHEILLLLKNVAENIDPNDISQEIALQQSQSEVTMAALVESCRKLRAAHLSEYEREFLLRCLDEAQEELYSVPDTETSHGIIAKFNTRVESLDTNTAPAVINDYIKNFYDDYPFIVGIGSVVGDSNIFQSEKLAGYYNVLHERYEPVFDELRAIYGDEITNDILHDIVNEYLKLRGLRTVDSATGESYGWVCEYNENSNGFRVKPKERKILCGKRTVEITWSRFEELMMHEVEIHVLRAENGYKADSFELATGLPGTSDAEEGTGLIMEQLWAGKVKDTVGRDDFRYLGIAYAYGVVDGQKHSKEETFDFLSRFMTVNSLVATSNLDEVDIASVVKKQRKLCFEHVFRMFRGMPEERVFLKDLGYYVGKHKLLQLLSETDKSPEEVIDYLQQGKFDPLNPIHQSVLRILGLRGSLDDEPI